MGLPIYALDSSRLRLLKDPNDQCPPDTTASLRVVRKKVLKIADWLYMNCAPMEEVVCETNQAAMLFRNKSVNRFFRIEEAFPCGVRDFRSESRISFPAIERVIAGPKRFPCRAVSGFDAAYSDGRRHLALFVCSGDQRDRAQPPLVAAIFALLSTIIFNSQLP